MRLPLTTALATLLIAGGSLAQAVDLRGPAPKADQTTVTTVDTVSEKGTLNMVIQGQQLPGEMTTKAHQEIQTKVLEVTEGEATKVETTYLKSKTTNNTTIMGQTQNEDDTQLEGVVMVQTKTADGWKTETKGGQFPPEAADLLKEAAYVDPRLSFPAEPVNVGHKWEIKDEMMAAYMGQASMPGAKFTGVIKFELMNVKDVGGVKIAMIDYDMDGAITMDLAPQGAQMDMTIKMKGKGQLERELTTYTSINAFKGDMDMAMKMSVDGQALMEMTAKMPIKTASSQETK